jgi:hypothetical protein
MKLNMPCFLSPTCGRETAFALSEGRERALSYQYTLSILKLCTLSLAFGLSLSRKRARGSHIFSLIGYIHPIKIG